MKIALFGGRFDPIHNGHIKIAKEVLKIKEAQEVWFSLENQHQWRPIVASVKDRMQMLKLAIRNEKRFKIDDTPIKLGGLTETVSVIRDLRKRVTMNIIFIAGSDQLPTFHKWTHWEELKKEVEFLIVARSGSPIENVPPNCKILEDPNFEPLDDSATRIRNYIKMGKSIHGLVPGEIEDYIIKHGLYMVK